MGFVGIEFKECDGGEISLVHAKWLTPKKGEVFWPPYKGQERFNKALKSGEDPESDWAIYGIQRKFFELDDYEKATKKIKLAEITSDLQSEAEEELGIKKKRISKPVQRYYCSDDDDDSNEDFLPNPPKVRKVSQMRSQAFETLPRATEDNSLKYLPEPPTFRTLSQPCESLSRGQSQSPITAGRHNKDNISRCLSPAISNTPRSSALSSYSSASSRRWDSDSDIVSREILAQLTTIFEQNKQILQYLKKQPDVPTTEIDLPTTLPVQTLDELTVLETHIQEKKNSDSFILYLSSIGVKEVASVTNNILRRCLSNKVAANFNFFGKGEKRAFNALTLNNVVIGAIKKSDPKTSEKDIEACIKVWLKHSPQRLKVESNKKR